MLDRCGVRFLSGWAIPEDKADEIIKALCDIRNEFMTAKAEFLATYDEAVRDWIEAHPNWACLISNSTVSREYVESKLTFAWQLYRVAPAETIDEQAAQDFGLNSEIENLGSTLFREISKDASDIWKNIFEGKTSVSQKALSPLRTMQTKLDGLSFVEPHVIPVHALIETALSKMPRKGTITGAPLLMLQSLVSLLKDGSAAPTGPPKACRHHRPADSETHNEKGTPRRQRASLSSWHGNALRVKSACFLCGEAHFHPWGNCRKGQAMPCCVPHRHSRGS
jgi:hypothetical protein